MKIEVLAFGSIKKIAKEQLEGVKTFEESHGRLSFVVTEAKFEKIHKAVKESGNNPFAVMAWQSF